MAHILLASVASNFIGSWLPKRVTSNSPKIVLITTAAALYDDPWWVRKDKNALEEFGCSVSEVDVAKMGEEGLSKELDQADGVLVAGGNTVYLLEQLQATGTVSVLKDFVSGSKVFIGSSAGAVIAGPSIKEEVGFDDRPNPPLLESYEGLGLVAFIVLPHWGSEDFKDEYAKNTSSYFRCKFPLITLSDEQAVSVEADGRLELLKKGPNDS